MSHAIEKPTDITIPSTSLFAKLPMIGGAMAVILAQAFPGVYAAVGVHSGIPMGVAHDLIAERPVIVLGETCPKCLRPLGVGIGLGHAPIYQAHCTECLARVGTLEILS